MGKKGKRARKAKSNVKPSNLFTKDERNSKVSKIYMQVMMEDMWHVIKPELRDLVQKYIDYGESVEYDLPLPRYTRTLQVRLYNEKDKDSFICFKYNRVTVEDGEKDSNPLNAQREKLDQIPLRNLKEKVDEVGKDSDDNVEVDEVEFNEEELAEMEKEAMKELEEELESEA